VTQAYWPLVNPSLWPYKQHLFSYIFPRETEDKATAFD